MILETQISVNRQAFADKVASIAYDLGVDPDWLMAVMYCESRINSAAVNSASGATGLIQFMPDTAADLGVSMAQLKDMSNVDQLDYVKKYLFPYRYHINSFVDCYLAVFFPAALGQPGSFVIQAPGLSARLIASQNSGMDFNNDSEITVDEFTRWAYGRFIPDIQTILKKKDL